MIVRNEAKSLPRGFDLPEERFKKLSGNKTSCFGKSGLKSNTEIHGSTLPDACGNACVGSKSESHLKALKYQVPCSDEYRRSIHNSESWKIG